MPSNSRRSRDGSGLGKIASEASSSSRSFAEVWGCREGCRSQRLSATAGMITRRRLLLRYKSALQLFPAAPEDVPEQYYISEESMLIVLLFRWPGNMPLECSHHSPNLSARAVVELRKQARRLADSRHSHALARRVSPVWLPHKTSACREPQGRKCADDGRLVTEPENHRTRVSRSVSAPFTCEREAPSSALLRLRYEVFLSPFPAFCHHRKSPEFAGKRLDLGPRHLLLHTPGTTRSSEGRS